MPTCVTLYLMHTPTHRLFQQCSTAIRSTSSTETSKYARRRHTHTHTHQSTVLVETWNVSPIICVWVGVYGRGFRSLAELWVLVLGNTCISCLHVYMCSRWESCCCLQRGNASHKQAKNIWVFKLDFDTHTLTHTPHPHTLTHRRRTCYSMLK